MMTHEQWLELLASQASLIDTFDEQIARRVARGESVELSRAGFAGELREYRKMLAKAPLDVLFDHASTSARSRHL